MAHATRAAVAVRTGRAFQACNLGDPGRSPSLLRRMAGGGRCPNLAVMFLAGAVVRLAAAIGGRVFRIAGRMSLRGRAAMRHWRRATVRFRNRPTDQLLDVAKERQFLRCAEEIAVPAEPARAVRPMRCT